ncbi:2-dehydro-3-deoxy-phosphogluconate/2-dehydro-3-deoxy-6-phosphogalactonate aldolase [Metallosphaera sp. J1]|uniref:bifunctional 2-dehydro-3-deoxy-phosphogluconate/2-dehydro-3-deoxy-6- phosphogalactonate aldolase n=1 Tax=Metallosphaera javensis (ex Hofmann et al. 2022) TaxID=99938 RepID=UPI001EE0D0B9|nr:bifunctional 2-dehydro-3-deoxy-phosphogluconate/2-dehydro-3-deoxy-6-phosphogalactonate aldolase [Metallosphaera javensis (ex Hofmann et al. 2022)]MCG3109688.1 2-dehydro-3-deoxy-phosphogluconate/2-dehydro-3-deoxy-6-phosphogalactonate aldolase [Metallosphaera javensis (ex Hofmann et al. 2022)]
MEVIVPILTPFNPDGTINREALKTHAHNLLEKGIDLIFLNGTTGLGPALSKEEKKEALKTLSDITDRIIFQVGELNLNHVLELVKFSSDYGVRGIASYSPYYFPRLPEKWLIKYFQTIVSHSSHPVYLYNYPLATGYDISAELLSRSGLELAGVKDTNQDLSHSMKFKSTFPKMKVYNGSDTLAFYSLVSLDGTVASMANCLPTLFVEMKRAISQGDLRKALIHQRLISSMVEIARKYGQLGALYVLTEITQGYSVGKPRPPIFPLDEGEEKELRKEVENFLKGLGVTA